MPCVTIRSLQSESTKMKKNSIKPGLYQHFKGNYYKVVEVARHSESEEDLVIYQALYGEKKFWARPLLMFTEQIQRDGKTLLRFTYCEQQSIVLELAKLQVIVGQEHAFEIAFTDAAQIISGMPGYISHQLKKSVETGNHYLLLVEWQTLEHHTQGFRNSPEYQQWAQLLHDFYEPLPQVEHYR